MKKSKIIAPALAVLTLSTAAAVTGTVAWFTASRVAKVSMSNITAVNPEAGLAIELADIQNTAITPATDEHPIPAVAHNGYFRDSSVDVNAGKVYRGVLPDNGEQPTSFAEVASPYKGGSYTIDTTTKDILYASVFKASFHVSRSTSYTYALFLDVAGSNVSTAANEAAIKGLRFGFKAGSEWFVWAPKTALSVAPADPVTGTQYLEYVSGTSAKTNFAAANVANNELPQTANDILPTTYAQNVNYLGVVPAFEAEPTQENPQDTLDVTIYTWIDGTEPTVRNNAQDLNTEFTANLQFRMLRTA